MKIEMVEDAKIEMIHVREDRGRKGTISSASMIEEIEVPAQESR